MWTHTHQRSTAQLLLSKNHQVGILVHRLRKAHVEWPGCPNASFLHPKHAKSSFSLKSRSSGCPPTREPNQSVVDPWLYHPPHCPLRNLPDPLRVGILHHGPIQRVSQLFGLPHNTISFVYVCNFGRSFMSHVWNHQIQHYNVALCVLP